MIVQKTKADGYFKVSNGAAQIQLRNTSEIIGIIHSATIPANTTSADFTIMGSGIEFSLGTTPCYVKVLTNGTATIAYEDISV